ncbi:hypothetical protein Pmani_026062 [Petrolisthes manimaculis]|uniref:Uncharacterized protein n=1 Tax=Petrolisthes manimaculis TaxID=1843537 RepID=A0AAE1P5F9_9EUCA|nr:hypothetical protein Pmani_026062 [Petrolisthes manimaculis]
MVVNADNHKEVKLKMGGCETPISHPFSLRLQHTPLPSSQGIGKGCMRSECTTRIRPFTATPVVQWRVTLPPPYASPLDPLLKASHTAVASSLVSRFII